MHPRLGDVLVFGGLDWRHFRGSSEQLLAGMILAKLSLQKIWFSQHHISRIFV